MTQTVHVRVRFEDQAFWATVDEYPGVFATGDTLDELRESLEEGISLVSRGRRCRRNSRCRRSPPTRRDRHEFRADSRLAGSPN